MDWFLGVCRKGRRKGKMLFTVRDIAIQTHKTKED
jgi:hypothetical protein